MHRSIQVRTQFEGFHRYADAPEDVAFLRAPHRHVFGVLVGITVDHSNRALEFFQVQRRLNAIIATLFPKGECFEWSCETMAEMLFNALKKENYPVFFVSIDEDGENGGVVSVDPPLADEQPKDVAVLEFEPFAEPTWWDGAVSRAFTGLEADGHLTGELTFFVPMGVDGVAAADKLSEDKGLLRCLHLGTEVSPGFDSLQCIELLMKLPDIKFLVVECVGFQLRDVVREVCTLFQVGRLRGLSSVVVVVHYEKSLCGPDFIESDVGRSVKGAVDAYPTLDFMTKMFVRTVCKDEVRQTVVMPFDSLMGAFHLDSDDPILKRRPE